MPLGLSGLVSTAPETLRYVLPIQAARCVCALRRWDNLSPAPVAVKPQLPTLRRPAVNSRVDAVNYGTLVFGRKVRRGYPICTFEPRVTTYSALKPSQEALLKPSSVPSKLQATVNNPEWTGVSAEKKS